MPIIVTILLVLSMLIGSGTAQTVVEVFDRYDVKISFESDNVHVKETITIKNVIDRPIVPGYAYTNLKSSSQKEMLGIPLPGKRTSPVEVTNVAVTFEGKQITDVLVTQTGNSTNIRYGLWFPIPPGENKTVILEYDSPDLIDHGILFTQGYYPIAVNIPVNNAQITVELSDGNFVTYSNTRPEKSANRVTWHKDSPGMDHWLLKYEYSKIPFPTSPVRWSLLLWIVILGIAGVWSYQNWKPKK